MLRQHLVLTLLVPVVAIHTSHDYFTSKFGLYAAANYSQAVSRELLAAPDMALYTPHLDSLFNELDAIVEQTVLDRRKDKGIDEKSRVHAATVSTQLRAGSTARYRHQTDFYYRLGTSPWIKTVCEIGARASSETDLPTKSVASRRSGLPHDARPNTRHAISETCYRVVLTGFNVGHSTAIWLASNPLTSVYSFDLFETTYKPKLVSFLKSRFPGRLHTFKGDSTTVVPSTQTPECDLVHIDGKHSYYNVIVDFLNMRLKSRRDSIFIFDDQCDPDNCTSTSLVPAQPTLGTCDLVRVHELPSLVAPHLTRETDRLLSLSKVATKMIEPVTTFYASNRQFALFRRARVEGTIEQVGKLPCAPLCEIKFGYKRLAANWLRQGEDKRQGALQKRLRPKGCQYAVPGG